MSDRLIMRVKQGEELNIKMTIKTDGAPFNLNNYNIKFQVKMAPNIKAEPIIDKLITATSDINIDGIIDYPEQGEFVVHLSKEDTSYPINEYYLIVAIVTNSEENIISSSNCTTAIYEICEQ